jgi:glutaminase
MCETSGDWLDDVGLPAESGIGARRLTGPRPTVRRHR